MTYFKYETPLVLSYFIIQYDAIIFKGTVICIQQYDVISGQGKHGKIVLWLLLYYCTTTLVLLWKFSYT